MDAAIAELQKPFLDEGQIQSSRAIMGLDTQLIDDGTYFVVEADAELAGCGGWSRRATLYGGDHARGRNTALLDPATDAARIRAMYTHPRHVRKGVGRLILALCEEAARAEGFRKVELMSTMAGVPLYRACGYEAHERVMDDSGGVAVPLVRMASRGPPCLPQGPCAESPACVWLVAYWGSRSARKEALMIIGAHAIIYSRQPVDDRAFLRDVLGLPSVDAGEGWLIFGLPPSEVAVHPSDKNDVHELYLICRDVTAFVAAMKKREIVCGPVMDRGWGLLTEVTLPGGGTLGVYQPRHPRPPARARATRRPARRPAKKRPAARRRRA
jgi:GNAT superfamily N-acetyltransferase